VQVGETAAWDSYVFWLKLHVSVNLSKLASHTSAGRRRYVPPHLRPAKRSLDELGGSPHSWMMYLMKTADDSLAKNRRQERAKRPR
jgi:hypothetical protein